MLKRLIWEPFFREFKGPIFALSYAGVQEVESIVTPRSISPQFFTAAACSCDRPKCISKTFTKHHHSSRHTRSTQPQAKFFQCQLQHQNDKTQLFCSREHLLLPRKRHETADGIFIFLPLLKEVTSLCFNYIWDFFCQLSATHFCDSPNTPAQYVPCGWEDRAFTRFLQGWLWDLSHKLSDWNNSGRA